MQKISEHRQTNTNTQRKVVAVTNLFHTAAEVHTCHCVPVTLEMSL